ncbi:MAG: molybdenum cofactor guanylyltransferase [Sphingopyxis sp.]
MTIPIVIAAGGNGSRIGGDKGGRMLGGITLLQRAVTFALTQTDKVAIAARAADALATEPRLPLLIDRAVDGGPLTALMSALDYGAACGAQGVLMMPCDMPFLPADLMVRLSAEGGSVGGGARVAMARSGARFHPICALWPLACRVALPAYAATSNGSLIGLARQVGCAEIAWPDTPFDPFFNINDADDLAVAEWVLGSEDI